MEPREKKAVGMSVPQFGGWDNKGPGVTDYSMVFSQARANKKHQKTGLSEVKPTILANEVKPTSLVNEQESKHAYHHVHGQEDPAVMGKKKILTYINCCIRP